MTLPVRLSAREHDVDLLVPKELLRMLLDHVVACLPGDVCVDAERADVERPSDRAPEDLAADDRNGLDVVELDAPPARHGTTLPDQPRGPGDPGPRSTEIPSRRCSSALRRSVR